MQATQSYYRTVRIKSSTTEFRLLQFQKPSRKAFLYFRNFQNVLAMDRKQKSREGFAALRVLLVNLEFDIVDTFGILSKPV